MDCRFCGTKMEVYKTDQEAHDRTKRELRCPTCKKRAFSLEKILQWLAPTTVK
jgi:DNA-directed RNA polymerase subunit RPC12/RpoP